MSKSILKVLIGKETHYDMITFYYCKIIIIYWTLILHELLLVR